MRSRIAAFVNNAHTTRTTPLYSRVSAICIVDTHKKGVQRSRNSDVTITEMYAYETEVILARFSEK